jgi:hypothetical protein
MKRGGTPRVQYRCSFCGKGQEQVHRLIAGPGGVYICNECIDLCREIIEEEQASMAHPAPAAPGDAQDAGSEGAPMVWSSGRARRDADEPASPQPSGDPDASGKAQTPDISTSPRQIVDEVLRARLVPLVAELEETRASIERLARENGALRERLQLQSREDEAKR